MGIDYDQNWPHEPGKVKRPKKRDQGQYYSAEHQPPRKGFVLMEAVIDVDGWPKCFDVVYGSPKWLHRTGVEDVSRWRFRPAKRDGEPYPVHYTVSLRYDS